MKPHDPYRVGVTDEPSPDRIDIHTGGGIGKTVVIAAVSAVAGAFLIKLMDRTIFAQDGDELEKLRAELEHTRAQPAALAAAPVAAPVAAAPPPAGPPPGIVRIEIPRERMSDEFWERLAGEGYE